MGSVRESRDKLPYSSLLLSYLLSDESGVTRESFVLGQWLAHLDESALGELCSLAFDCIDFGDDQRLIEGRADLVLVLEVALFEEPRHDLQLEVTAAGSIALMENLALCAGLEILRRHDWVALNFLSINLDLVQTMVTTAGHRASAELLDASILRVFTWLDSRPSSLQGKGH